MNFVFYAGTVLIWGTTWLAITFQLGVVDPMISVIYRFALAAALLQVYCRVAGLRMRFALREHLYIALQGTLLFALNYWIFYAAELYLTSGLVAVVFSTIVFQNILFGALLLGDPIRPRVVFGASLGLVGIGLVFWPELSSFNLSDRGLIGFLLSITATVLASLGNIAALRNQRAGLPIIQTNAYGMTYGTLVLLVIALAAGKGFLFEVSFAYISSMLYLSIFGSIIAFGLYLTLVGRIGADRAAYAALLFPVVALVMSTLFEGYQWTGPAVAGVALILTGNVLAMSNIGKASLKLGIRA
jgi:drug/metabolite transporter (DMT)-like permease